MESRLRLTGFADHIRDEHGARQAFVFAVPDSHPPTNLIVALRDATPPWPIFDRLSALTRSELPHDFGTLGLISDSLEYIDVHAETVPGSAFRPVGPVPSAGAAGCRRSSRRRPRSVLSFVRR